MASYEYDSQNQELKRIAGGTLYADCPIGSEIEYAGTTAPTGFLKCDGSTYSQVTYPELYAILGTTTLPNKSGYIIKAKQIGVPADFASAIEDVIDEKFSYSTSEVNTGKKWIDGNPIYRRVFTETMSIGDKQITIPSGIRVISFSGTITNSNGLIFPIPYFTNTGGNFGIYMYVGDTYLMVIPLDSGQSYFNGGVVNIILEYTKTTD